MPLKSQIQISSVWTDELVRAVNNTGAPLVYPVADPQKGGLIAGVYRIDVTASLGSGNWQITVTPEAADNPYLTSKRVPYIGNSVIRADTDTLIPLPGIRLRASGTIAVGQRATVYVGKDYGILDAFGTLAGQAQVIERVKVINTGSSYMTSCAAKLLPSIKLMAKGSLNNIFAYAGLFAPLDPYIYRDPETEGLIPSAQMTFANRTGSGDSTRIDVLMDGDATYQVLDIDNEVVLDNALQLHADGAHKYRWIDFPFTHDPSQQEGFDFILSPVVADTDVVNVMIFPSRFVKIAPDTAGVHGTFDTVPVPLTESGQSAGLITAGGAAYFWREVIVGNGEDSASNPYQMDVALVGIDGSGADWWA